MNLLSLRYFIEIAKTLNFTQASKNLHVSQPALSQQIHLLEEQLQVKLLHRTTRKVNLTEEGEYLFEKLALSFEQIENTVTSIMEAKTLPTVMKIATIPSAACFYLPKVLRNLYNSLPDMEFSIKETTSAHVIELIKNKEYHIGFIRTPIDFHVVSKEEIQYMEFKKFPIKLVVSSEHHLAVREKVKLKEISKDFFLHYDPIQSPALYQLVNNACKKAGFKPRTICTGSELLTISNLLSSNVGVTMMPVDMFELIKSPHIKALEIEDIYIESSISLIWENSPFLPLNTKYLIDLIT
ncbi:LysR family transcriptional regulator [Aneurinibacillus migulanus]|uniref:Transcriptional regulator, LysR family n=1 Tax=Aneurinibacillus migulanus TaxID=47500 RepID=A0A0K2WCY8_ANEMI|nr:LysR family transcriptional regulator [Aneurinibacillus migulanus]MED0896239.1 LysR family transcriptional regulator [Aneurinibacillus migulanus]MED1618091.1 LysR family transcriptional regulator [Aneurinibacillus migulanus]MED4732285.1 LysR family transcriptional regulator [Aneurinibacillus migulanus]CEH29170.1 HTH-type transcriptional regulator BsdA [Aneurinibacillus migulanus]SDJ60641.1 transcriptional regulator, LysR family [Aneurinibacillus migulanus]